MAHRGARKIARQELAEIQAPEATKTHKPIAHIDVVNALVETLSFRKIAVVRDEYAVSVDGMKMFGVMDLEEEFFGCRFSIGLRNANDKSMRLGLTIGYRVFVCDNMAFRGDFTPLLAKHTASTNLIDLVSVGVDRMQRNFAPLKQQVEWWQNTEVSPDDAKLTIYSAFVEGGLQAPKHLMKRVHDIYFNDDRFPANRVWRLSNAFTTCLKELDPLPQFQTTAKVGAFLSSRFPMEV